MSTEINGTITDTDILVIGAGAGGLLAALSAKRNGTAGTRVTIVDAYHVGRSGHTAFSNAWTVAVFPEDDLEAITREIIEGNDWVADQPLVSEVLATSYDRMKDLEGIGLEFPKEADGSYHRRPTRGLKVTRVLYPVGGGLEFSWKLRRALEDEGVEILDRIFITGLMRGGGDGIIGAVGVHSRTGDFHVIKARSTIVSTNAATFRSGFVRDLTGTGTLLAYKAGAAMRNAEFGYLRPTTPKFYFEGIAFAIQDGARFVNSSGQAFMRDYEPDWGDEADVPRIARAMAMEAQKGNAPIYLDMSRIPDDKRDYYFTSKVKWMDHFLAKLGEESRTDMFGKTLYFPQCQMTKMGIATGADCRSDVPGLLSAGLAQAGCANHFAGFHIGMCIGTGWISGESAVADMDSRPEPRLDAAEVKALHHESLGPVAAGAEAASDRLLLELQTITARYDVLVWKHADRLGEALSSIEGLMEEIKELRAPDTHELVRLKETEAMLLAAELVLRASIERTESRMSHFREDYDFRDDENWLAWIDITEENGAPVMKKTPIPTPIHPCAATCATPGAAE